MTDPTADLTADPTSHPSADPSPDPSAGPNPGPGRGVLLPLALAILCLLLAAAAAWLALDLRGYRQDEQAGRAALAAARQEAVNLTSIDYQSLEPDLTGVLELATGAFKADFSGRAADLRGILTENKVVSTGQVLTSGLAESSRTRATALVVVDSTVANTADPQGQVRHYRMQMDLERIGGAWFVSSLQFVG